MTAPQVRPFACTALFEREGGNGCWMRAQNQIHKRLRVLSAAIPPLWRLFTTVMVASSILRVWMRADLILRSANLRKSLARSAEIEEPSPARLMASWDLLGERLVRSNYRCLAPPSWCRNLSAQIRKCFQLGPSVWPPSCWRHARWPPSRSTFTAGIRAV